MSGGFFARGVFVQVVFVWGFMSGGFCLGFFVLIPLFTATLLVGIHTVSTIDYGKSFALFSVKPQPLNRIRN